MLPHTQLKDMLLKMHHIRKLEEQAFLFFALGEACGTMHLYAGEEEAAVGICAALKKEDYITSTHQRRDHCLTICLILNNLDSREIYNRNIVR